MGGKYNRVMATRKRQADSGTPSKLSSVPAAAVRDFLLQSAELQNWPPAYLQKTLAVDAETARGVVSALSIAGYIEPDPESPRSWRNTGAGNLMAKVSRARPIARKTAEKNLDHFMERVRAVNLEPEYLYAVEKAVVFGPYQTTGGSVKNVDIAVQLTPKIADEKKLSQRVKADAERAESEGKRFKRFADRQAWGKDKVRQYLRGRSRAISLYDVNESILAQPHRVLYER
jgi:hypothetical protein